MKNILFISYYTTGYYKEVMNKYLLPSLKKFNLPYHIEAIESKHNRTDNIQYKPKFILECLEKFPNKDLVWTDADSVINKYPKLFYEILEEYDVAIHTLDWNLTYGRPGREILSGTLLLKNRDKVKKLVELWQKKAKPHKFREQLGLRDALQEMKKIKVYDLPRIYCYIENCPNGKPLIVEKNPVVSHYQISRHIRKNQIEF